MNTFEAGGSSSQAAPANLNLSVELAVQSVIPDLGVLVGVYSGVNENISKKWFLMFLIL